MAPAGRLALAAALFVFALLVVLLELQSPEIVLWNRSSGRRD